ncbi:hypothetical protein B0A49_12430 [Cryomyces minteri]|uniref:Uncharacterized protein n=1 Tax=Cryomyces minteri TaxID=331657 RepID=A0A4U0VXQ5_9PEZI|nr:hypothetical protein B0A49_12430 [Cryomyces minteri]
MPTNRPFLSNFLAAFRAHSALQKAASAPATPTAAATSQTSYTHITASNTTSTSVSTSTNAVSNPRTVTTKAGQHSTGATAIAIQAAGQFQLPTRSTSPYSRSPASPTTTQGLPIYGPPNHPSYQRQRRGSDSSSEGGFRDALGAEKWYIGGRTAGGEERFYKLGMVKRNRSIDRLSLDRLSL